MQLDLFETRVNKQLTVAVFLLIRTRGRYAKHKMFFSLNPKSDLLGGSICGVDILDGMMLNV